MKRILTVAVALVAFSYPAGFHAQGPPSIPGAQGRGGGPGGGGRGAQRPARDATERATGTAIIRGRIVTTDTGAPIRRAQVRAVSSASRETRLVTTDAQGGFEFRDLPAGRWEISASKAGFVTMRFGQRRAFEAGRPIEVADGQTLERANFSLPRGAAITGRVLDEFGDPVAAARVQALRYQVVQGTRRLVPVGAPMQSDDTGAFRLYGLMPGDYYVSAVLRALPVDDSDDAGGYAPTYYPGTGSVTEAQLISLTVGQEATISFGLMPVRTARISGSVVTSMGIPLAGGMVTLTGAEPTGMPLVMAFGAGNRVRPDGTFTLTNVAPGSYTLTATNAGPGAGRFAADAGFELGSIPVTVAGEDLTGITLVTSPGAILTGSVGVARGSAGKLQTTGLQITTQAVPFERGLGALGARPVRVESDGTFMVTNLFGSRLIRLNGLPQDWMLESVIVAGADVTDRPIDFPPGGEVTDAQILVTDRVTQVEGTVAGRDGKPSRDFAVVVFPDDDTKWASPSRYLRSARPDQEGVFKIRALPPNDRYLAIAVDYLEDGEGSDPEFLSDVRDRATRFRLAAGESATVNLKLVER